MYFFCFKVMLFFDALIKQHYHSWHFSSLSKLNVRGTSKCSYISKCTTYLNVAFSEKQCQNSLYTHSGQHIQAERHLHQRC